MSRNAAAWELGTVYGPRLRKQAGSLLDRRSFAIEVKLLRNITQFVMIEATQIVCKCIGEITPFRISTQISAQMVFCWLQSPERLAQIYSRMPGGRREALRFVEK